MADTGIVVIGRNEGARLQLCLHSLVSSGMSIVYVDSGSTDGSQAFASQLGIAVVELDLSLPFTAARARNAGFFHLLEMKPQLQFVQFVDGDCIVDTKWLPTAATVLQVRLDVAVVCGRRRERNPQSSIYNQMCDIEWNTPIGEAKNCGGDSMMRVDALSAVNAFDSTVMAGEEPELCMRLRKNGWKILRLDAEMTLHDVAMTHFSQWWQRTVRGGYGAFDVGKRQVKNGEAGYMRGVLSAWVWGFAWPLLLCAGVAVSWFFMGLLGAIITALVASALWLLQSIRIGMKVRHRAPNGRIAFAYGVFTLIGKWAQMVGHLRYALVALHHKPVQINYKGPAPSVPQPASD